MSGARQARAFGEINQYHHATSCIIIIILVIVIVTISIISCNRAWVDCLGLFLGATSFVPSTSTPTASSHPLSLVFSVRLLLHVLASPPWAFVWVRFSSSVVRGSGAADLGPGCILALLIIVFDSGAKPANRTLEQAFALGNVLGTYSPQKTHEPQIQGPWRGELCEEKQKVDESVLDTRAAGCVIQERGPRETDEQSEAAALRQKTEAV
jgi:hypothetical protein